jgi:HNH endonuclease
MSLSPSGIQTILATAINAERNLAKIPDDFLKEALAGHDVDDVALRQAVEAIYKSVYYGFVSDMELDAGETAKADDLARILDIDEDSVHALNYQVGLGLYRKAFKEAVSDGDLTKDENAHLDEIIDFFELQKRDTKKTVAEQALWYYSFKLAESLQDGVLNEAEMGDLAVIAKRFGLSTLALKRIPVPQKMEVLRAALTDIKSRGEITDEDKGYIEALASFLNADDLLKPCMMDLELYAKLFTMRKGKLPEMDPGALILEDGEHLHYKAPVCYEYHRSGKAHRQNGTLFVGSVKLRFVGRTRSHEIRYKNLLEVSFQNKRPPRIHIMVSSGKGSGTYRLTKSNSPPALLELKAMIGYLIDKAQRVVPEGKRDTAHISRHVAAEVWERDGGECRMCGAREYLEFDHIIPRSKGGATSVNNLQLLCRQCNSEKSDKI